MCLSVHGALIGDTAELQALAFTKILNPKLLLAKITMLAILCALADIMGK